MIKVKSPTPSWFNDQPVHNRGDDWYLERFWELSSERQIGMELGPIPFSKIKETASEWQLSTRTAEGFTMIIRAMDREYLKWIEKEKAKSANVTPPKGK